MMPAGRFRREELRKKKLPILNEKSLICLKAETDTVSSNKRRRSGVPSPQKDSLDFLKGSIQDEKRANDNLLNVIRMFI